jgi:hypothetical protein
MYWLAYHSDDEGVSVVIQPAPDPLHARFATDVAKLGVGKFTEGHKLDAKMVKRLPKDLIGKRLTTRQAGQLLDKLAKVITTLSRA